MGAVVMNSENSKHRVPTSAELEAEAASTAANAGSPWGLLKFFRVGRFRVADEVGARKHVAEAPQGRRSAPSEPLPQPEARATPPHSRTFFRVGRFRVADEVGTRKHVAEAPKGRPTPGGQLPQPEPPKVPLAPRTIRISASVRDRRGSGPGDR